jgi:hypothetical protein
VPFWARQKEQGDVAIWHERTSPAREQMSAFEEKAELLKRMLMSVDDPQMKLSVLLQAPQDLDTASIPAQKPLVSRLLLPVVQFM